MKEIDLKILARFDPVVFAREYLGFTPYLSQEKILRSLSKRMMLNCCRQYGKTSLTAIRALWHALYHPGSLILIVAKAERQAQELLRKVRQMGLLVKEVLYVNESKTHLELDNGARIISLPSSSGGIRGYSAPDIVICDEAARITDELFVALKPMLMRGGIMIMLSTPAGKRGFFWHCWTNDDSWEKWEIPVDQNPGATREFIETERRTLPDHHFRGEYLCKFIDVVDAAFDFDYIEKLFSSQVHPMFTESLLSEEVEPL